MKVAALTFSTILVVSAAIASEDPTGTVPRSAAFRYPAHAEKGGVAVGAQLLTTDEARKTFASDITRCCLVVEVAVYPQKDESLDISRGDFVLRVKGTETAVHPQGPKLLALMLQKAARSKREVSINPVFGVGYESGTVHDPNSGQAERVHGVSTSAGVGVGVGGTGSGAAAKDRDRETMELELTDKGLGEGAVAKPVAGYLYFPLIKKDKKATFQLEYMLNGSKVVLPFH